MKLLRTEITNLKRKNNETSNESETSTSSKNKGKRQRIQCDKATTSMVQSDKDTNPEDQDELDDILQDDGHSSESETSDLDLVDDFNQFFDEPTVLGEEVNGKLAEVLNKSLRSQPNEEKFKKLVERHRRPTNMENLQTPKVDLNVWKNLPSETKSHDVLMQKSISDLSTCLVPIVRILEATQSQDMDRKQVQSLASDAVKMITYNINSLNTNRKAKMKKAMLPKYKTLCDSTKTSATQLFGDSLKEDIKSLNDNPTSIVNNNISSSPKQPFLFRGGARGLKHQSYSRFHAPHHQFRNNQQQNFKHNNQQQTRKQKLYSRKQPYQKR
jgi:hypothetical protein